MAENVDDVFEKYGNLFRFNIKPGIERLYLSPPKKEEITAPPKEALSIIKKDGMQEQPGPPPR